MSLTPIELRKAFLFLFSLCLCISLNAQRSLGGSPASFSARYQQLLFRGDIPVEKAPALDLDKIKREDAATPGTNRFAAPVNVNFSLENNGIWKDLPGGGRVWRMQIKAKGALGLFIYYKNFYLPNGAQLFVYDGDGKQLLGSYSHLNNQPHEKFMTGMIKGETAIIEYFEPWYAKGQGRFEIDRIMQAYHPERMVSDYEFQVKVGFGDALACHQNINCSTGANWQDEKRGVVRILVALSGGLAWCSGSLINNTDNNGIPYLLSAHHCSNIGGFIPDYSMWRFDFNYEFPSCPSSSTEPVLQSLLGCSLISTREQSDFLLLQLFSNVPSVYNAYFNGWNRGSGVPQTSAMIHHPNGDVKKISHDGDLGQIYPNSITWNNGVITPANHHFKAVLDIGTMEGGSSGCPFFDEDGRIIAQLHGGNASCSTFITYHGRFAMSWDQGGSSFERLSDWLDPTGTGVMILDGMEAPATPTTALVEGNTTKENGDTITNVEIQVSVDTSFSVNTNPNGTYIAQNLIIGDNFTLTPVRDDNITNGVTTFDMVLVRKHILSIEALPSPYKMIAADINKSGSITTFDMVLMQKAILGIDTQFSNNTSWRFVPESYVFPDPTNPFSNPFPEAILIQPLIANMVHQDFVAIKVGDMNDSAN